MYRLISVCLIVRACRRTEVDSVGELCSATEWHLRKIGSVSSYAKREVISKGMFKDRSYGPKTPSISRFKLRDGGRRSTISKKDVRIAGTSYEILYSPGTNGQGP